MGELRSLFEDLGFEYVSTYIQSGNVLFSSPEPVMPGRPEQAIKQRWPFVSAVALRSAAELQKVAAHNPFPSAGPETLHIGFCCRPPELTAEIDADPFAPEEFAIVGSEVYLSLPNGMGRARLPAHLDRRLGVPMTVRNWRTVQKLAELASE